jgi:hypothetical protein
MSTSKLVLNKPIVSSDSVGLSYSYQSHRTYFTISTNEFTGECKVQPKTLATTPKKLVGAVNAEWKEGQQFREGLTYKGKAKIQKAVRILELIHTVESDLKAYCTLGTLTYGRDYPTDHESKKHLDMFLKRCRRKFPEFKYVWVIEKQKRGAPHFHILTPYYIPKEWINKAWNEIVNTWQLSNSHKLQTVLPNVIKVDNAGAYMSKYLSKEGHKIGGNGYGIDTKTRALMKDNITYLVGDRMDVETINEVVSDLVNKIGLQTLNSQSWTNFYNGYGGAWLSDYNEFSLKEFIEYDIDKYQLNPVE